MEQCPKLTKREKEGEREGENSGAYHSTDHPPYIDGVAAGREVLSRVPQTLGVHVQQLHADVHHILLKLKGQQRQHPQTHEQPHPTG